MRKLLIIALLFISFSGSAQIYQTLPQYGYTTGRFKVTDLLWIPTDTTTNKTGIARIGSTLYAGNGTKWTAAAGSGTTGIDSVTITSTGCVKTFSTWSGGTESVIGTVTQPNGLAPGTGIATKTTGTTFTVTAATYTINCITYQSRDTTIILPAAGDTGRIDVIKVNTSGVTTQGTGTEGEALSLPSLSATELALTYVLVTDTGVTVSLPTDTALWVSVGTSIRNANTGPVNVRTHLQIGTYTPGNWLTSGAHTNTYFVAQDGFYLTNPANSSLTKNGISQGFGNAVNMWAGSNIIGTWGLVGNGTGSQFRIFGGMNPASGTGEGNGVLIDPALSPSGANSKSYNMLKIAPTYTQGTFGTGTLRGIYYNPILTSLNTSPHYFIEATSGLVKLAGITAEVDTTTWKPMAMNSSGDVRKLSYWPVGSGGGGGGSVGTLQQVTTLDSTTTHEIILQGARLAAKGGSTMYGNDAGTGDNSTFSVGIGYGALSFAAGVQNVGIGFNAAQGVIGDAIIGIGRDAAINYVGFRSVFIGDNSGDNGAGYGNVGIGSESLSASFGTHVTAVGDSTGHQNTFNNVSIFGYTAQADSTNQVVLSDGVHQVRLDHALLTGDIKAKWQNKSGTIAYLDDITTSTSDTIFVDAPLEAYTSGDSNKIRINPDTLAAWRNSVEPTFTIDLSLGDYTITEPGIYIVTHGDNTVTNAISFPDPTTMPGASITILNNDTLDNYNADYDLNKPIKGGQPSFGGEWTTLVFPEMHTYKSIGGSWRGGSYGQ